jgi:hypothetical protein
VHHETTNSTPGCIINLGPQLLHLQSHNYHTSTLCGCLEGHVSALQQLLQLLLQLQHLPVCLMAQKLRQFWGVVGLASADEGKVLKTQGVSTTNICTAAAAAAADV